MNELVDIEGHEEATEWSFEGGAQGDGHVYVQWKGTNVCMDFTCPRCGFGGHIDADFVYEILCGECGQLFKVSCKVGIKAISEEAGMMTDPAVPE